MHVTEKRLKEGIWGLLHLTNKRVSRTSQDRRRVVRETENQRRLLEATIQKAGVNTGVKVDGVKRPGSRKPLICN